MFSHDCVRGWAADGRLSMLCHRPQTQAERRTTMQVLGTLIALSMLSTPPLAISVQGMLQNNGGVVVDGE